MKITVVAAWMIGLLLLEAVVGKEKDSVLKIDLGPLQPGTTIDAPLILNITSGEEVSKEEPLQGTVQWSQHKKIHIELPAKGSGFSVYPNVLLTLTTENDEGDADIACVPGRLDIQGLMETEWKSDHAEGLDFVYISSKHGQYDRAKQNITIEDEEVPGVMIQCSVHGYAREGTDFLLEVDVNYNSVSLAKVDTDAMQNIYDKCCPPSQCPLWGGNVTIRNRVSMDFCHSPGSICNEDGRLVRLDLRGQIPGCELPADEISKLTFLEKLELDNNGLEGDMADVLKSFSANLKSLTFLSMRDNQFQGLIDKSVCKLSDGALTFLDIHNNGLSGTIPECLFGESSSLKEVFLGENELEGNIPEIPPTSPLQILSLKGGLLSGSLPESLGRLKNLKTLDVSDNDLDGELPATLGSSKSLRRLHVNDNAFKGTIPGSFVTSTSLWYIYLDGNYFSDLAEEWFSGDMSKSQLQIVDMANNQIQAAFPRALTKAHSLQILEIEANKFHGPLPNERGMFENLLLFTAKGNRLSGELPEQLAGIGFLNPETIKKTLVLMTSAELPPQLDLSLNEFTGSIPEYLSKDNMPEEVLREVYIGGNNLNVPCPVARDFRHIVDIVCGKPKPVPKTPQKTPTPVDSIDRREETELKSTSESSSKQSTTGQNPDEESGDGEKSRKKSSAKLGTAPAVILILLVCILVVSNAVFIFLYKKKKSHAGRIDRLVNDVELPESARNSSGPV